MKIFTPVLCSVLFTLSVSAEEPQPEVKESEPKNEQSESIEENTKTEVEYDSLVINMANEVCLVDGFLNTNHSLYISINHPKGQDEKVEEIKEALRGPIFEFLENEYAEKSAGIYQNFTKEDFEELPADQPMPGIAKEHVHVDSITAYSVIRAFDEEMTKRLNAIKDKALEGIDIPEDIKVMDTNINTITDGARNFGFKRKNPKVCPKFV